MATFPPDLEAFVQLKLATGAFGSRDELAAEAIRVYRDLESRHGQLKSDVQAAIAEVDQGLITPLDIDSIKAEIVAELTSDGRPV